MGLNLHRRSMTYLIVLMLLSLTAQAIAGDLNQIYHLSLEELGKVTITSSTGNKTLVTHAPSIVSVITSTQIDTMGARYLDDILETIPGLHVSLSSLNRLDSVYSIRGIHTGFNPHVLLMMNGIPVQFNQLSGRPQLLRLPTTFIRQVEVIRGPGSAVYGADAFAGIINIITKDPSEQQPHTKLGIRSGSFGYREYSGQVFGQRSGWNFGVSATYQKSDGDNSRIANSDLQSTFDSLFGTNASLAPGPLSTRYTVFDAHATVKNKRWQANLWHWRSSDTGIGAGAAQALDPEGEDKSSLSLMDISYQTSDWIESWNSKIQISRLYYDLQAKFNLLPPGTVAPIGSDGNVSLMPDATLVSFPDGLIGNPGTKSQDTHGDFIGVFNGWENHRLRVALGFKQQEMATRESKNFGPGVIDGTQLSVDGMLTDVTDTPYVFAQDSSRLTRYISVQDEWTISPQWQLTSGIRYDSYSDFGETTNPRLALVWGAQNKFTVKLLYGSAFRAPSFSEQFNENNPVVIGSQDLDPERINTLEFSLNAKLNRAFGTSFNVFRYQAYDMIEFVADAGQTTNIASNARDQYGRGFEWEFQWNASNKLNVSGNYSWQHSRDPVSNMRIPDAPKNQLTLGINWELLPKTYFYGQVNWVGKRHRAQGDARPRVEDYSILDMAIKRKGVLGKFDLSISIKNVLNQDAYEPSDPAIANDYKLEKRSIVAEFTFRT